VPTFRILLFDGTEAQEGSVCSVGTFIQMLDDAVVTTIPLPATSVWAILKSFRCIAPHAVIVATDDSSVPVAIRRCFQVAWFLRLAYCDLYTYADGKFQCERYPWQVTHPNWLVFGSFVILICIVCCWLIYAQPVIFLIIVAAVAFIEADARNDQRTDVRPYHQYSQCIWTETMRRLITRDVVRHQFDPELGWRNTRFEPKGTETIRICGLDRLHQWTWRHNNKGNRLTSDTPCQENSPVIAVLGCSYTYGVGLSDAETFPWLLQTRLSDYAVLNYGVAGYSLVQMLMQLPSVLSLPGLSCVVVGFHDELHDRDSNSLRWRASVGDRRLPRCCYTRNGNLRTYHPVGYERLPFSRSSISVRRAEYYYNSFLTWQTSRGERHVTPSVALMKMKSLCASKKVPLLIAVLSDKSKYHEFFYENGFSWCTSGIDLAERRGGELPWTQFPVDNHPNAEANACFSSAIAVGLEVVLAGERYMPQSTWLSQVGLEAESLVGWSAYPDQ